MDFAVVTVNYKQTSFILGGEEFMVPEEGRELLEWIHGFDSIHIVKLENVSSPFENMYLTHYSIYDERVGAMFLLRWKP